MPNGVVIALTFAGSILAAPIVLGLAFRIATHSKRRILLIMTLTDAAAAISAAATSINSAATALTNAVSAITALNDTTALDAPVADLGSAVTALTTAAAAVESAAGVAPAV